MSFSRPERGFVDFLSRSLALLRSERPDVFARFCASLSPRVVRLCVDEEAIALAFSGRDVRPIAASTAHVDVASDRGTILAVLAAELTLHEAVMADRLTMRGSCGDLQAFHDGLLLYLHGAVRAPSFPALLSEFRQEPTAKVVAPNCG